ncbi:hypothetical protein V8F33_003549 [Rhypophila sp. PSN 637]
MSGFALSSEDHPYYDPNGSYEDFYDADLEADTSTPCTTWVYSESATVPQSIVNFFVSYREFGRSTVTVTSSSDGAEPKTWTEEIVGVGAVEIPVRKSIKAKGPAAHHKLRLQDVLHVPSSMCNILAGAAPGMDKFEIKPLPGATHGERTLCDKNNRQLAILCTTQPPGDGGPPFEELKLSGPPVGPVPAPTPSAQLGKLGSLSTAWTDDKDRARWMKKKTRPPGFRVGRRKGAGGIQVTQMLFDSDDTEEELERQDRSLFVGYSR